MHEEEDLAPELAALLDVERDGPGLPDARREAIRIRLEAALAPAAALMPSEPGSPVTGGRFVATLAGRAVIFALGALAGALGHAALSKDAPPAVTASPMPVVSVAATVAVRYATPAEEAPAPPMRAPAPTASEPSARVRAITAPPASVSSSRSAPEIIGPEDAAPPRDATALADERAMVERGRAALARRDGISALEALRQHATKYPTGQLAEERDALEVQALAIAGRPDDARRKAALFGRRYPDSVFRGRVEDVTRQLP